MGFHSKSLCMYELNEWLQRKYGKFCFSSISRLCVDYAAQERPRGKQQNYHGEFCLDDTQNIVITSTTFPGKHLKFISLTISDCCSESCRYQLRGNVVHFEIWWSMLISLISCLSLLIHLFRFFFFFECGLHVKNRRHEPLWWLGHLFSKRFNVACGIYQMSFWPNSPQLTERKQSRRKQLWMRVPRTSWFANWERRTSDWWKCWRKAAAQRLVEAMKQVVYVVSFLGTGLASWFENNFLMVQIKKRREIKGLDNCFSWQSWQKWGNKWTKRLQKIRKNWKKCKSPGSRKLKI